MVIDGRKMAENIFVGLEGERGLIDRDVFLGIVAAGDNPVIDSFVRIKERAAERLQVTLVREAIPDEATAQDVEQLVRDLAHRTDGIIVQLPLPIGIDIESVLAAIPNEKDVDGVGPLIAEPDRIVRAPVAEAVREILQAHATAIEGKKVAVVGAGRLVGRPTAAWFANQGADVHVITNTHGGLEELKDADIVICGAGEPGLIKPDMIKEGCVLIDAGTSEAEGRIAGDADPACAAKCSLFTPVPGGVGPIAVAMIFKNLFELAATT